jgi:hypothetical protein
MAIRDIDRARGRSPLWFEYLGGEEGAEAPLRRLRGLIGRPVTSVFHLESVSSKPRDARGHRVIYDRFSASVSVGRRDAGA